MLSFSFKRTKLDIKKCSELFLPKHFFYYQQYTIDKKYFEKDNI